MSQNRDTRLFTRMNVPLPILEHPSSEPRDRDTSRPILRKEQERVQNGSKSHQGVVSDPSSAHGWGGVSVISVFSLCLCHFSYLSLKYVL